LSKGLKVKGQKVSAPEKKVPLCHPLKDTSQ